MADAHASTVADVARRYGVSPETVCGWIAAGELAALNVARDRKARRPSWRVTAAALAAFEAGRAATPAPAPAPRKRRAKPADVIQFYV